MDGRQSGCYAPIPASLRFAKTWGKPGLIFNTSSENTAEPRDAVPNRLPIRAWLLLAVCLAIPASAIWGVGGFVTQDGPAHLYNAEIILQSFSPESPFRDVFEVRRQPLPNWGGHLLTVALVRILPPRSADRVMTTLTLSALPITLFWLRWRVSGRDGLVIAAPWSALIGLNVTWLLGFNSFLLGASLFPITLGLWWNGRDEGFSARRAAGIAIWITLGYFCHLISLGLTAFGLIVLEVLTPSAKRRARLITTFLGLLPLVPLGWIYLGLMRQGGGGLAPEWKHLQHLASPRRWIDQLTWIDPVSLARKDYLAGFATTASWHYALAPAVWLGLALALIVTPKVARKPEKRGWWVLGIVLLIAGLLGPDTLGATHGEYLQQRIVLLGLVSLVTVLPLGLATWRPRAGCALVVGALAIQTITVWDYARWSDRTAGAILQEGAAVGRGQRVATLLNDIKSPFRSNPLLHADCALGVGTGNVIWSNYETRFYYFPVQFRKELRRPESLAFEKVALSDDPVERRRLWTALVNKYADVFDRVIVWKSEPEIDADNAQRFTTIHQMRDVRILSPRRDGVGSGQETTKRP